MILIAPDKFKGTMSAREAARIIAGSLRSECELFIAPMADGGEGTAEIVGSAPGWRSCDGFYHNEATGEAILDSSRYVGAAYAATFSGDIMTRTSRPLAEAVNRVFSEVSPRVLYISVGGTSICDGGSGFIEGLDNTVDAARLVGLCDVAVPLVAEIGEPSALMFAPQKGATPEQLPRLAARLRAVQQQYGGSSRWDGAGGGLGYALASALGARCVSGAEFVLSRYNIDWTHIHTVITGEGSIDDQTDQGKVAAVLAHAARVHGARVIAIGGTVRGTHHIAIGGTVRGTHHIFDQVISTTDFLPDQPLTPAIARRRLAIAASSCII